MLGNATVFATYPNLLIKPRFGKVVTIYSKQTFSTGEHVWLIRNLQGEIIDIHRLTDENLITNTTQVEDTPYQENIEDTSFSPF